MQKVNPLSLKNSEVYLSLVNSIKQEITKTRDELQRQKAICYWKIGRHIDKHLLNNEGKTGYGERLYPRLSHDLKINVKTLREAVAFHRSFPIPDARPVLSWTHYRDLLKITDQNSRDILFNKVKNERVTTRELQSQIKHIQQAKRRSDVTLDVKQGTLYTYLTDTQDFIKPVRGRSVVDVGFGLLDRKSVV